HVAGIFQVTTVAAGASAGQLVLTLDRNPARAWAKETTTVTRVRLANPGGAGPTLLVSGASILYPGAIAELDNGTSKETLRVLSVQGNAVTFTSPAAAGYRDIDFLNLVEAQSAVTFTDE